MQFAKAEVQGLNNIMQELFDKASQEHSYDFIKLTHHSSYNGLDEEILDNWLQNTHLFAHTGGLKDANHPEKGVLKILKSKARSLKFARTDHNGTITVQKEN